MTTSTFFQCEEARFEFAYDTELVVSFRTRLPKVNQKSFYSPIYAGERQIGWLQFEYAVTLHGRSNYRATRLHQVGDIDPDPSDICRLLSTSGRES